MPVKTRLAKADPRIVLGGGIAVVSLALLGAGLLAAHLTSDSGETSTQTTNHTRTATPSATATPSVAYGWSAKLSGFFSGNLQPTATPDCMTGADGDSITLDGTFAGHAAIIVIKTGGHGTFDLSTESAAQPNADLKIPDSDFVEWFGKAADPILVKPAVGSGTITVNADDSGSMTVTLPPLAPAPTNDYDITIDATWTC